MAQAQPTTGQVRRISAGDLKQRLEAGEPVTLLDVRGPQAWDTSREKVRGAVRVDPRQVRVDSGWPKDRLTVAY